MSSVLAWPAAGARRGSVVGYDGPAGYGTIRADDGSEWWFHCTSIADGSREIAVGTPAAFCLVPGRSGRWEAAEILAIRPADDAPKSS